MIRVEIDYISAPGWAFYSELAFAAYVCKELAKAGVPIVGGPLLPKVDFSKGSLTTWDDHPHHKKIYVWEPKEAQYGQDDLQ